MFKIGIYCKDTVQRKEIKKNLKLFFEELKIELQISDIRSKKTFLENITERYMIYSIVLQCEEERITYVKNIMVNHVANQGFHTLGWLNMPLCNESIDKMIFYEEYNLCPFGIYKLITKNTIRVVTYGDIEYCLWNGEKTIMFLKNNETEELRKSIVKIKSELAMGFFVACNKGYIINFYNVKKIDRVNHEFVMHSGHKIPISPKKYSNLVRLYINVMFGL